MSNHIFKTNLTAILIHVVNPCIYLPKKTVSTMRSCSPFMIIYTVYVTLFAFYLSGTTPNYIQCKFCYEFMSTLTLFQLKQHWCLGICTIFDMYNS